MWPKQKGADVGPPDVELLKKHLRLEGRLAMEDILLLVRQTKEVLSKEPNVVKIKDPVVIVGDLHGQYYDMLKMLDMGGTCDDVQYLFLGDYVDRGSFSCEVVFLLFALKLNFPNRIWMLRGNHECRQMTEFFNFKAECEHKYSLTMYEEVMEAFDWLPVAGIVNGKFLCLHGGISPELVNIDSLYKFNRNSEPPRSGLFCDVLWSDPAVDKKEKGESRGDSFMENRVRGCSYLFSFKGVCEFLARTGLLSVVRAHEVQAEGYKMHRDNAKTGFPCVITVFSAPNYCDVYNNKAAVLKFANNTLNILQYHFSKHPYHLPTFMSLFAWSLPFVSEKVVEILQTLLEYGGDHAHDEDDGPHVEELPSLVHDVYRKSLSAAQNKAVQLAARMSVMEMEKTPGPSKERENVLRSKIMTVGRMQRMFKAVRQAHEAHVQLNGLCPADRLDVGALKQAHLNGFKSVKKLDKDNEMMPDTLGMPQMAPVLESDGEEEVSTLHGRHGEALPYSV
jgi:serine/threonine-protein phosphatase 2B catalytic subunit